MILWNVKIIMYAHTHTHSIFEKFKVYKEKKRKEKTQKLFTLSNLHFLPTLLRFDE